MQRALLVVLLLGATLCAQTTFGAKVDRQRTPQNERIKRMRMSLNKMQSIVNSVDDVKLRQALQANVSLWQEFIEMQEEGPRAMPALSQAAVPPSSEASDTAERPCNR